MAKNKQNGNNQGSGIGTEARIQELEQSNTDLVGRVHRINNMLGMAVKTGVMLTHQLTEAHQQVEHNAKVKNNVVESLMRQRVNLVGQLMQVEQLLKVVGVETMDSAFDTEWDVDR